MTDPCNRPGDPLSSAVGASRVDPQLATDKGSCVQWNRRPTFAKATSSIPHPTWHSLRLSRPRRGEPSPSPANHAIAPPFKVLCLCASADHSVGTPYVQPSSPVGRPGYSASYIDHTDHDNAAFAPIAPVTLEPHPPYNTVHAPQSAASACPVVKSDF